MKHLVKTIGFASIALALTLSSCGGKKGTTSPDGGKRIKLETQPCSQEGQNTKEYFAASGIGESSDRQTAQKKALSNARERLGTNLQVTVKAVTDNYVNSREYNNVEEIEERYESLGREVVDVELRGLNTVCLEEELDPNTNKYICYVAIRMDGEKLLGKLNEGISNDERLKIDYDYEKFKETFNQEMEKAAQK